MPGTLKLNSGGAGNLILTPSGSVGSDVTLTIPAATATLLTNKTAGTVLQVVQATKTDTWTSTTLGAQWVAIPGQGGSGTFGVTITPSSASNKILVFCYVPMSFQTSSQVGRAQLQRNGTAIFTGDSAGNRPLGMGQNWAASAAFGSQNAPVVFNLSGNFLDSPATTSAVTYSVAVGADNVSGGGYAFVNLTHRDANNSGADTRTASSIIAMEIAG